MLVLVTGRKRPLAAVRSDATSSLIAATRALGQRTIIELNFWDSDLCSASVSDLNDLAQTNRLEKLLFFQFYWRFACRLCILLLLRSFSLEFSFGIRKGPNVSAEIRLKHFYLQIGSCLIKLLVGQR